MTEHTVKRAGKLTLKRGIFLEIRFDGGDESSMRNWLGNDLHYSRQKEGDLGLRMRQAFDAAFTDGASMAVVIGTDCPEMTSDLVERALCALVDYDLVLGPAKDGGYYLIGLRQQIPELFEDIAWGTEKVFEQTVEIANRLKLRLLLLEKLGDIDRPEDLRIWERISKYE